MNAPTSPWLRACGLALLALGAGGCELIPGLVGGGGGEPDPGFSQAPLSVEVQSAEGTIEGVELAPDRLAAFGERFGSTLQFDLAALDTTTSIQVALPGTDSSDENPYFFEPEGPGGVVEPVPGAEDPGAFDPQGAIVVACGATGECRTAEDFAVEIQQLPEGRSVVIEGAFGGDDRVRVAMIYTEPR